MDGQCFLENLELNINMSRREEILAAMRDKGKKPLGKPKGTQLSTALRTAFKCKQGEVAKRNPIVVKAIKKKLLMHRPATVHGNLTTNTQHVEQAIAEHLAGETQKFVDEKYNCNVRRALQMYFPDQPTREQILEDILLDNALISAVQFQDKAEDLNARDAAVAAGIFTQKFSEFKRARQSGHQEQIPINLILQLNNTLENVKKIHGPIIEMED